MPYYSEEDRRKAVLRRELNQKVRQMQESPEDSFDIWGVKVPKVDKEPYLTDYGLPDSIELDLAAMDEQSIASRKKSRLKVFFAIVLSPILIILFTPHPELLGNVIAIEIACFIIWLPILMWALNTEAEKTPLHDKYDKYKSQKRYYDYWQRKKDKNHWNSMDGHSFENAVANLFREVGFMATVSKKGGDGGIDIILEKGSRRIAVQCKRYKSPVGPHVIRDLWGTMNYLNFSEGCIVTTTGFTKGVKDFSEDRGIFLIDLNDILRSTNDDQGTYLLKIIGG